MQNLYLKVVVSIGATRYNSESAELSLTLPQDMLPSIDYHSLFVGLWQAAINDFQAQQIKDAELEREKADHEYTIEELKPV